MVIWRASTEQSSIQDPHHYLVKSCECAEDFLTPRVPDWKGETEMMNNHPNLHRSFSKVKIRRTFLREAGEIRLDADGLPSNANCTCSKLV